MFGEDGGEIGVGCEVRPFVRIGVVVVEFFGAIGIADEAIAGGADGVIAGVVGGEGGGFIGRRSFEKLGGEAGAVTVLRARDVREIGERGKEVEEFGGILRASRGGDFWAAEDEWDARGAFPEGVFSGDSFFAEVPAVIAEEDDDGVVFGRGGVESGEETADLLIHEGDAREIGAGEVSPLLIFADPFEAGFGEFPMEVPGEGGNVVAVGFENGREQAVGVGEEIVDALGGVTGDVGEEETDHHQPGFVGGESLETLCSP